MATNQQIEAATRLRRAIIEAKLTRHERLQLGLLAAGGMLLAAKGLSVRADGGGQTASPFTQPFVEEMPIPKVKEPIDRTQLTPAGRPPTIEPNNELGGHPQRFPNEPVEGRTRSHQRFNEFPPQRFYELHEREADWSFHRDLPSNKIWGFDGVFPGPLFLARYGKPILVRIHNDLPQDHRGFGLPSTSTHLHNGHIPSESDGFPGDFFPIYSTTADGCGPSTAMPHALWYDHHYPNIYAGYDQFPETNGDPREALGTLWYHDHRMDFTAQNTYKGLAGMYVLFDELDSGNENDTGPGLRLPDGKQLAPLRLPAGNYRDLRQLYDVPLVLADKVFDRDGQLFFDMFNFGGILGDKFTVNGKIQPFFRVARRKYRFRVLNTGPSRFYQLFLTDGNGKELPFTVIANDGNLLPAPVTVTSVELAVAERMDIIVDFDEVLKRTGGKIGDALYLVNRLEQLDGRGPTGKLLNPGNKLLKLIVDRVASDSPPIPATLRPLPPLPGLLDQLPQRALAGPGGGRRQDPAHRHAALRQRGARPLGRLPGADEPAADRPIHPVDGAAGQGMSLACGSPG